MCGAADKLVFFCLWTSGAEFLGEGRQQSQLPAKWCLCTVLYLLPVWVLLPSEHWETGTRCPRREKVQNPSHHLIPWQNYNLIPLPTAIFGFSALKLV